MSVSGKSLNTVRGSPEVRRTVRRRSSPPYGFVFSFSRAMNAYAYPVRTLARLNHVFGEKKDVSNSVP